MLVDLQQRELLAQLVFVAVVRVDVDRLSKKKCFVESVELLLDRLRPALDLRDVLTDLGLALLPRAQHVLSHQPHVARRGLQLLQFIHEQAFELRFADVHGAALTPAVVIRVPAVSSLRPARGQRPAARLAPNQPLEREIRTVPLVRAGHLDASFEDGLNSIESFFADKWLKITSPRYAEFRDVNEAGVQTIREHPAEALWIQIPAGSRSKAEARHCVENLFLRESTGREFIEGALYQLAAFGIGNEVLA